MFTELLDLVISDANAVHQILVTNDRLRKILDKDNQIRSRLEEIDELKLLINDSPHETSWRVCDHCSAVTRLYAIYEQFVKNLIIGWLDLLPNYIVKYEQLEERIRNTHRVGVGKLLIDLSKDRFNHLPIEKVVGSLFDGISGKNNYNLIPEAFLLQEQNLRKAELNRLICNIGIENAWDWIENHRNVKEYIADEKKAEYELNQLVLFRNRAAHGAIDVDEILGVGSLTELVDFTKALCIALEELFAYSALEKRTGSGEFIKIGDITEWFAEPDAGVAKISDVVLSQEDEVILASKSLSYCCSAKIISIQEDNEPRLNIQIKEETELGLKFDVSAREGLEIYIFTQNRSASAATPAVDIELEPEDIPEPGIIGDEAFLEDVIEPPGVDD